MASGLKSLRSDADANIIKHLDGKRRSRGWAARNAGFTQTAEFGFNYRVEMLQKERILKNQKRPLVFLLLLLLLPGGQVMRLLLPPVELRPENFNHAQLTGLRLLVGFPPPGIVCVPPLRRGVPQRKTMVLVLCGPRRRLNPVTTTWTKCQSAAQTQRV